MKLRVMCGVLALAVIGQFALGADLYGPDQMSDGTNWGINSSADVLATFGYNYSADGIPEAPNSMIGDVGTTGLKAEANLTAGAGNYFTAFPVGQNFTGTHQLTFDAWMNFEAGAGSSTEFLGGGIGYDGVTADVASGAQCIATGEGGSGSDWRAFKSPPQFFIAAANMAGGTRQGSDLYYADFLPGGILPPEDQEQDPGAGGSIAGSPGFQWATWIFTNVNGIVTIDLQKPDLSTLRIVTIDCLDTSDGSNGATYEGNISLFYADFFASLNTSGLNFGLFDNVRVTDVPEPASLLLLGLAGLMIRRR